MMTEIQREKLLLISKSVGQKSNSKLH